MKVHVVSIQNGDDILGRLLRELIRGTGWSVSDTPDDTADLNYFFPYLEYPEDGYFRTKTAAWFTHRDVHHSAAKVARWDKAAQTVDLRITSAELYRDMLVEYGETVLIPTAVEPQFKPMKVNRKPNAQMRVGIAGMVYPGGRKGENLVRRLKNTGKYDLTAIGRGWPIPSTFLPFEELPRWYAGLDVFLCTSLVEGIGHPVLEALACGVPVVIPIGVGVFDELGHEGIYRYLPGEFEDMVSALEQVQKELHTIDAEALTANVTNRTGKTWVNLHQKAFENASVPPIPSYDAGDGKAGVFYVAYGDPAKKCLQTAVISWATHMDEPIAVCSDTGVTIPNGGTWVNQPDRDIGGRWNKTRIYDLAPADWEYVLYLDADTEIIAPVDFLFDALRSGWELVITKNPDKYVSTRWMHRPDNQDEVDQTFKELGYDNLLQWNGGVFAFRRCPRVKGFFDAWHEEWQRWGGRDQAALLRAMWRKPLRVLTLGNEWNTVTRYYNPSMSAGILHYPMTARRWDGRIDGRLDSKEAWGKIKK